MSLHNLGRRVTGALALAVTCSGAAFAQTPPRPPILFSISPNLAADTRLMGSTALSGQTTSILDTTPANPVGWPETFTGMSWYNASFADIDTRHRYDGKNFLASIRSEGKKVSIEVSAGYYLNVFCSSTYRNDQRFFYDAAFQKPRFAEYGDLTEGTKLQGAPVNGQVDYVIIDDPFLRAYDRQAFPLGGACVSQPLAVFDFEFIKGEVIKYMQLVKARLPNVKFILNTSTAHWNYTTPTPTYYPSITGHGNSLNLPSGANLNYKDVLDSLVPAAATAGVPLDGLIIDYPYNFVTQTMNGEIPSGTLLSTSSPEYSNRWARLTGLVAHAHNKGIKAYVFLNSDQLPTNIADEVVRSQKFHDETNSYMSDIISKSIPIDNALVSSWYYDFATGAPPTAPRALLPETTANSFTNTARDVLYKVQAYNEPVFGVIGNVDGISSGTLFGWACGQYNTSSVKIHLYTGTASGPITFAGLYTANQTSEPAVATACKASGMNYRFAIPVAGRFPTGTHLYVYGMSPIGGWNKLLPPAPGVQMP